MVLKSGEYGGHFILSQILYKIYLSVFNHKAIFIDNSWIKGSLVLREA